MQRACRTRGTRAGHTGRRDVPARRAERPNPNQTPFIGCLDYVFTSPHFRVVGAPALPHRDGARGPYPTEAEPSDHLLLAVQLELPLRA